MRPRRCPRPPRPAAAKLAPTTPPPPAAKPPGKTQARCAALVERLQWAAILAVIAVTLYVTVLLAGGARNTAFAIAAVPTSLLLIGSVVIGATDAIARDAAGPATPKRSNHP